MRGAGFGLYDVEFRSPIESDRINDAFRDIYTDIGEATIRAQYIENKISSIGSDISYQEQQQTINMLAVSGILTAANTHYDTAVGGLLYWNAYNISSVVSCTGRHDPVVGDVSLPWRQAWTQLPLYKNEYGEYESTSDVTITIGGTGVLKPHDAWDMVDNNPETTWVTTYPTDPGLVEVILTMPNNFSNTVNSVLVNPFPVGGCMVTNLYYDSDTGWMVPDGFEVSPYPRRYYFSRSSISGNSGVKFKLKATPLYDSLGNLVYVIGMKDVDISLVEFGSTATFTVKLESGNTINNITYVNVGYTFDGIETGNIKPMSVKLSANSDGSSPIYNSLSDAHPFPGTAGISSIPAGGVTTLWAIFTLTKLNGNTPVVRDITVRYN